MGLGEGVGVEGVLFGGGVGVVVVVEVGGGLLTLPFVLFWK